MGRRVGAGVYESFPGVLATPISEVVGHALCFLLIPCTGFLFLDRWLEPQLPYSDGFLIKGVRGEDFDINSNEKEDRLE